MFSSNRRRRCTPIWPRLLKEGRPTELRPPACRPLPHPPRMPTPSPGKLRPDLLRFPPPPPSPPQPIPSTAHLPARLLPPASKMARPIGIPPLRRGRGMATMLLRRRVATPLHPPCHPLNRNSNNNNRRRLATSAPSHSSTRRCLLVTHTLTAPLFHRI